MRNAHALQLPALVGLAVADHVATYGRRSAGVETGGFLLTRAGRPTVEVVAVTGGVGIVRLPDQFRVSGSAIEVLSEWADERGLRIGAQFHSHGATAFLSEIDRASGFRVAGFTTTVVPTFADPPSDPASWGWWHYADHDWQPATPPASSVGQVEVVTFDETGVS